MPRPATGSVVVRETKTGPRSFALRYRVPGVGRVFEVVGYSPQMTRRQAEELLQDRLADVRAGRWKSREQIEAERRAAEVPTFHVFASEWFAARELEGLRERTLAVLRWHLVDHLLPAFARLRLDEIDARAIDDYVRAKVREGRLSNGSINRTVSVLARILAVAVEYDLIAKNPAASKARRLPTTKPKRLSLEPPQVLALLDAAGELDAEDRTRRRFRRALLATLAYAGLRVGELLSLRWRDVDLARAKIRVAESKTDAGVRVIDIQPELIDEMTSYRAGARFTGADDYVFGTSTGRADHRGNVRKRVLLRAVERANQRLAEQRAQPGVAEEDVPEALPEGLSPHALRRSFISWLIAEGEDVAYVQDQAGHTDPSMTLGVYARAVRSKARRPHARRARGETVPALDGHSVAGEAREEDAAATS